jgi:intein-encoded DNA endonuclease-like protein
MKWNPTLQSRRPIDMIGMDQRRIRLRPTRSIRRRAVQVMRKFVTATVREVKVGLSKPNMVKMVAEKYIKEFYKSSQLRVKLV